MPLNMHEIDETLAAQQIAHSITAILTRYRREIGEDGWPRVLAAGIGAAVHEIEAQPGGHPDFRDLVVQSVEWGPNRAVSPPPTGVPSMDLASALIGEVRKLVLHSDEGPVHDVVLVAIASLVEMLVLDQHVDARVDLIDLLTAEERDMRAGRSEN